MTRIETSRAPRATLSLPTRKRGLSLAMIEQIEEVEPRDAATDVKETVTVTGDEAERRVSGSASAMGRGGTIPLAAAGLAMSRPCAMFGAWAGRCAMSPPSSLRESQAEIDVELPKTAVAALLVVMHLLRAQGRTRMTRLGARRAEDRCPATATTRL